MNFLDKQFGRLGNRMFQMAALYSFAQDFGTDIYFQDEKFFKKYVGEVKSLYSQDIPPSVDKVSIHVRRGDYVGNSFYTDLTETDYYQKAMAEFPNKEFLMFSDDILWCMRKWDIDKRIQFSVGNTEEQDLMLMAACKHNIIANSSFSWWAAYLNPNPDKKVIYPKAWYTDGVERTVCPKEWHAL